jgi:hypothetical protein
MDNIKYEDNQLIINYSNYGSESRNYGDLFDFLGDFDIVTASELGQDEIVMSGIVFSFTSQDEARLKRQGSVILTKELELAEYIERENNNHLEFLRWYSS